MVPLSAIEPNKDQPRREFDEEKLQQLADSISRYGVLQPLLVRDMGNGRYQLLAGERRWRAARLAGLTELPVQLKEDVYKRQVQNMCRVAQGCNHGPAPIPEEGAWVPVKQIEDISGLSHGIGWCAPQQGGCKLTLNVKKGIIEEALVEVLGCSGMTHSAAMAAEILQGKTLLEALNTDLVCDAINVAMREVFKQLV